MNMDMQAKIDDSKKKRDKILKISRNVAFSVIMIFMAFIVLFALQSKILGIAPTIAGYKFYNVVSGSMEPKIHKGVVVFVKSINPDNLAVDDIITFENPDGSKILVTHRIIAINKDKLSFITRGDANDANDLLPVTASKLIGKTNFSIPLVGYFINFIQSKIGILIMVIIPGVLIIIFEMFKSIKCVFQFIRDKR